MADKITQAQAGYGVRAGTPCHLCLRFDPALLRCSLVLGRILPTASCRYASDEASDGEARP